MVQCRGIFAAIVVHFCDGSYIAFVMKKVNGPTQAKLERGTLVSSNDCASPGHPPAGTKLGTSHGQHPAKAPKDALPYVLGN